MKRVLSLVITFVLLSTMIFSLGLYSYAEDSSERQLGDVNGDQLANMKDVLILRKYFAQIIKASTFDKQAADANQDNEVDMKDILMIRKHMAGLITLGKFIPKPTQTYVTTKTTALRPKQEISHSDPKINFINGSQASLGVWWWHQEPDGQREEYMDFLKENQVTEIYFYCAHYLNTADGRETAHKFTQSAMKRGMRVAALFDVQQVVNQGNTSFIGAADNYLKFKKEYPNDNLYGLHCDIEPQAKDRATDDSWNVWFQNYTTNFLSQVSYARDKGIWVELDIGCGWDFLSRRVTYTQGIKEQYMSTVHPEKNEDGSYTMRLFDAIANGCDVMCMMSYRDTAPEILKFAANGRKAADKAGTKIVYGVETGNDGEGEHVDFYGDSKEIMYTELSKLLVLLEQEPPTGEYGFAIHYMRQWFDLRDTK